MVDKSSQIGQQVTDKIKSYNQQRAGLVIVAAILFGILFFFMAAGDGAFAAQLSAFCSAVILLCYTAFVFPFWGSLLLLLATTSITAALLVLNQIHFEQFLILFLINAGMVFISNKIANATIRSFTKEIEEINRLKTEAATDSLTQLLNRNGLEQAVGPVWALCKRDKKNVCIILADIDYFKSYNDTLGHLEGDNILRQVADIIRSCFRRETDIISRIGGDEFLIFLSDINDEHVLEMAQSLSSSILNLKVKTTLENNPGDFLSVSMGIATSIPQTDDLLINLYKAVDEALYFAKRYGRNCIAFHKKIIQIGTEYSA